MDKEELVKEALGLVAESTISLEDYALWTEYINMSNTDMLAMIIQTLSGGDEVIQMATTSLKAKHATGGEPEKLKQVIESEKEEIKKILNEG